MAQVLEDVRVLMRSIKRHYRWVEERTGFGGAQIWALSVIGDTPGIRSGELAERLHIHRSTVSNLLKRLVAHGLVDRTRTAKDQREVRLTLTPRGKRTLKAAPRPAAGVLQQALLDLPRPRLNALAAELHALLGAMQRRDLRARHALLAHL